MVYYQLFHNKELYNYYFFKAFLLSYVYNPKMNHMLDSLLYLEYFPLYINLNLSQRNDIQHRQFYF